MSFVRLLGDAVTRHRVPPNLEILYEEQDGAWRRSLLLLGNGNVKFQKITNGKLVTASGRITLAEVSKILSHLFVNKFWSIKSKKTKGKQITLSVRINKLHKIVTLPHKELTKEKPFLISTVWTKNLLTKLEKHTEKHNR